MNLNCYFCSPTSCTETNCIANCNSLWLYRHSLPPALFGQVYFPKSLFQCFFGCLGSINVHLKIEFDHKKRMGCDKRRMFVAENTFGTKSKYISCIFPTPRPTCRKRRSMTPECLILDLQLWLIASGFFSAKLNENMEWSLCWFSIILKITKISRITKITKHVHSIKLSLFSIFAVMAVLCARIFSEQKKSVIGLSSSCLMDSRERYLQKTWAIAAHKYLTSKQKDCWKICVVRLSSNGTLLRFFH